MKSIVGLHRCTGIVTVIIFLGTGVYMRLKFLELYQSKEVIRYIFRANHVYVLFSGLLILALGTYFTPTERPSGRRMQSIGSSLILLAPLILILAFLSSPCT